jgi:sua5/yciO/yrdC/ywlC family protein
MNAKEIIHKTLSFLQQEKVILYPTDTIWGLGCDAFSQKGIQRIQQIKQRPLAKSFILLVSSYQMLQRYVAVSQETLAFLDKQERPTSVIYTQVYDPNLPEAADHSLAFRVVKDPFCKALIEAFDAPLVSTSANISGEESPMNFSQISEQIKKSVDYIVPYRREEQGAGQPSQLLKIEDNQVIFLRK